MFAPLYPNLLGLAANLENLVYVVLNAVALILCLPTALVSLKEQGCGLMFS